MPIRLVGLGCGKIGREMQELHIWSALAEFLDQGFVRAHSRTANNDAGLSPDNQRDGVGRIPRGENFVARSLQQNFQVRK